MKKKICVVTASRSEYGLLRWLMNEIRESQSFELQLLVSGSHLSRRFGLSYKEIEKDGFKIDAKVDMHLDNTSRLNIATAMGRCAIGVSKYFDKLSPDLLIVLGDRYELLPICNSALVLDIPIAHISGGDTTEGVIDDHIRNAISMMASLHFPGTKESGAKLVKMGVPQKNVFIVGEPGLENFKKLKIFTRKRIAKNLNINYENSWILLSYHPETKISIGANLVAIKNIVRSLKKLKNISVVVTYANADWGGHQINSYLESIAIKEPKVFSIHKNLGQSMFTSLLRQLQFMIGNSSSGIVEAPFVGCPVINVGNRQKGRYVSKNIINSSSQSQEIINAIENLLKNFENYCVVEKNFGSGNTSTKILRILKKHL